MNRGTAFKGPKTYQSWSQKATRQRGKRQIVAGLVFLIVFIVYCNDRLYNRVIVSSIARSDIRPERWGISGVRWKHKTLHQSDPNAFGNRMIHIDDTWSDETLFHALSGIEKNPKSCIEQAGICVGSLLMVNRGALDLYRNFLHYLGKLHLTYDFIVCTSDPEVSALALSNNHRVILVRTSTLRDEQLEFGTQDYQEAMLLRTRIINVFLQTDIYQYWLVADTDSVWKCNPFEIIFDERFIEDPFDVGGQLDDISICGGFLLLRASPGVRVFWKDVADTYQEAVVTSSIGKEIDKTEQGILNDFLRRKYPELLVHRLNKEYFPSGEDYFDNMLRGNTCVIHNNFLVGIEKKIQRFKEHNLWMGES